MAKNIENIVPFPINAQRNSFFGALSSILLYRNAYTEDTPFFCGKYQRSCIRCGDCGDEGNTAVWAGSLDEGQIVEPTEETTESDEDGEDDVVEPLDPEDEKVDIVEP